MPFLRSTATQLISAHNDLRERLSAVEFFGPRYQKYRERSCAGHFSLGYSAAIAPSEVEFEEPDPQNEVDFWLVTPSGRHAFQITERQEPSRRRGQEYKSGSVSQPTEESLHAAAEHGTTRIAEAVIKKERAYAGLTKSLNLLVYINFPAYELRFEEVKLGIQQVHSNFASIWLLTGDSMACPQSNPSLGALDGWYTTPARAGEA